jgi:purine-nucleoside phosphorylase
MGKHETPVMLLVGRAQLVILKGICYMGSLFHVKSFYEGHSMDLVTFATRVCKRLDVETMIGASKQVDFSLCYKGLTNYVVTNAAGGLNQEYEVGDIVMLKDVSFPFPSCLLPAAY